MQVFDVEVNLTTTATFKVIALNEDMALEEAQRVWDNADHSDFEWEHDDVQFSVNDELRPSAVHPFFGSTGLTPNDYLEKNAIERAQTVMDWMVTLGFPATELRPEIYAPVMAAIAQSVEELNPDTSLYDFSPGAGV